MGALVNAVFLFALCFSITVQAIKRFLVLEKIEDPKMILIDLKLIKIAILNQV